MSRLSIALLLALSTSAFADRAPLPHEFAQPPVASEVPTMPRRTLDRATVRDALVRARAANLAAFRAYQKKGVFPSNTFSDGKLNVWRDADGHLCAAATIIDASGQHDLVTRVADQSNFIRLADVKQGPLMDWILTSGFTQEEIAAIQEPFMPVGKSRVEPDLRTTENDRLRAKYAAVDKMLVANQKQSLDLAVDRLMKHPQLAWQLVDAG
jgi:hypothetical protein